MCILLFCLNVADDVLFKSVVKQSVLNKFTEMRFIFILILCAAIASFTTALPYQVLYGNPNGGKFLRNILFTCFITQNEFQFRNAVSLSVQTIR